MAHGLRCFMVCGIFLDQVSNPCRLHWQADSSPLSHQGSPLKSFFLIIFLTGGKLLYNVVLISVI